MLIYLTSKFISSIVAFLYPGYASYKTLSQRPASEEELERWLMYWSVLGCIVGIENVAEWLISWLPLYYPMKTLFLLYLSLPQTRGSSYLYINYLQPFLHKHESEIDATLMKLKARAIQFIQGKLRMLWDQILGSIGQQAHQSPSTTAESAPPPSMNDPASGPAQMLGGLWRTYGPTVIAQGTSLFMTANAAAVSQSLPQASPGSSGAQQFMQERRRQLEAELASLRQTDDLRGSSGSDSEAPAKTIPTMLGTSSYLPTSPAGSDVDLRARVGQYEEVEVPSDVEGYDVAPKRRHEATPTYVAPAANRRTSWFGWGASTSTDKKDD